MSILPKWSKECKECNRRYPSSCGVATCLQCKTELERTQKDPTVTESEWKDLAYIYGRTIPGPLSVEDREQMEHDWESLEAEALKRGSRWSVADLIGDAFGSVRAA